MVSDSLSAPSVAFGAFERDRVPRTRSWPAGGRPKLERSPWRGRIGLNVDTLEPHHFCAMVIDALGNWALIAGEYIASTRVDGMLNVPAPLSRIR